MAQYAQSAVALTEMPSLKVVEAFPAAESLPGAETFPAAEIARLAYPRHRSLVGINWLLKRTIDVVGSLVGLILLAPVFLIVAIAIKLDSKGPAIFKQRRVGLYGREFNIYKFRSMYLDAEARRADLEAFNEMKDGPIFKMANDPRVTRVGRFIRKTSLDEFPQLLNVLLGQMSLVGPRPPLPSEVEEYTPSDWERLTVMPGATGLWQISGRSDLGSFRAMVQLDRCYMETWSAGREVWILLRTVAVVLRMQGSF